jgi:hypothetical protein
MLASFIDPAALLVLVLATGCSRQTGVQASAQDADQQLPFAQASDKGGVSPTGSLLTPEIPAGTPITIRLQAAISSATSQAGDTFEAVLDEPIILQGGTVITRSSALTGRVVAAKASGRLHDPGYLKLTLTTISILGKSLPLQCSSIFEKGGSHVKRRNLAAIGGGAGSAYATGSKDVGFAAGRRLTFRLTQSLTLPFSLQR